MEVTRIRYSIRLFFIFLIGLIGITVPRFIHSSDFVVYSIYQTISLGNPGETTLKDYYVNMGSTQGVRAGSTLEVLRIIATYDINNQKLYKDMIFPIGTMKVIHVENNAAIARLEKLNALESTPAYMPRAVMVGDRVRLRN